jgi:hypothetical protein
MITAIGFSPENLVYNSSIGQKQCQIVTINSDSKNIIVSDKWAENKDTPWNPNLFNVSASDNELSISYDKKLSINDRTIEVCISGKKAGEYHGILLIKEEQVGNSVVQAGIWIKAVISDGKDKSFLSSITGAAIGLGNTKVILVPLVFIIVIVLLIIYIKNKKRDEFNV